MRNAADDEERFRYERTYEIAKMEVVRLTKCEQGYRPVFVPKIARPQGWVKRDPPKPVSTTELQHVLKVRLKREDGSRADEK